MANSLPVWNDDWETPDPLRGKAGWELRDYVNIAVAFTLVITAIALIFPALSMAREAEARVFSNNRRRVMAFKFDEPRFVLPFDFADGAELPKGR